MRLSFISGDLNEFYLQLGIVFFPLLNVLAFFSPFLGEMSLPVALALLMLSFCTTGHYFVQFTMYRPFTRGGGPKPRRSWLPSRRTSSPDATFRTMRVPRPSRASIAALRSFDVVSVALLVAPALCGKAFPHRIGSAAMALAGKALINIMSRHGEWRTAQEIRWAQAPYDALFEATAGSVPSTTVGCQTGTSGTEGRALPAFMYSPTGTTR